MHVTMSWQILFNQNEEMKWKISESNLVETSCTDKTANVLGTHVRNECTTSHLRAPPSHLNTPDHWEASEVLTPSEQEGVALTSDHMMTSSYHGDENQQVQYDMFVLGGGWGGGCMLIMMTIYGFIVVGSQTRKMNHGIIDDPPYMEVGLHSLWYKNDII